MDYQNIVTKKIISNQRGGNVNEISAFYFENIGAKNIVMMMTNLKVNVIYPSYLKI